jgi:ADP-heptose:LPS heptosyltransferase
MSFSQDAAHGARPDVIPGVRKIAVLRANAIGDFIHALPAFEALRAAYPVAEIVLLGQAWHKRFLDERPGAIDRVVVVPPYRGVSEPDFMPAEHEESAHSEVEHFFDSMALERFDLAIQLHGGGRHSNPFLLRLGAWMTAGLKTPDAAPLDRWIPYVYFQPEILRYLEVVSLVGSRPVSLQPRLAVTEADLTEAHRVVPDTGRPLAALHPGAGDPKRRWSPEKFAAVGDALAAMGAHVVVTGGREDERALVDAVLERMQAPVQGVWGRLSLGGLAGLLSRCRVVVAGDSGPLHVASAVGAATVGIYWCGNMITAGLPTRARHRPAISWRLNCPICGSHTIHRPCDHSVSFVDDVTVDEVIASALQLFELEGQARYTGQSPHSYV